MTVRRELGPMLRLAAPLALAELGWMAMGVVDTIMAGPLGATAVGAGGLGGMVFYPIAICGIGMLLGMDTLVSQAFGARDEQDCRRTLVNGVWLALGLAPVLMIALAGIIPVLRWAQVNPRVMTLLTPYVQALLWGVAPLLLYAAFRRYLQAVNIVKPVTFALVSANLVNAGGNWILMYGHWGAPAMGLTGSGWSTSIARLYMASVLLAAIVWNEWKSGNLLWHISWRPKLERIRRLVALGLPSAGQILFEGAVFAIVTTMAARLDDASLAAHGIAVNVIATTYMVPLGISSAAAVRVGQACGRKEPQAAGVAGWTALLLSGLFMGAAGIALWIAPALLLRAYIHDPAVVAVGTVLLRIAAVFELFDGWQVTATGALRGLGDTRTPMLIHLGGYWAVGLPVAYILCFPQGWGARGIWVGLSAALILIGSGLVAVWHYSVSRAARGSANHATAGGPADSRN
jgi:MATE family multidrug resistance protein